MTKRKLFLLICAIALGLSLAFRIIDRYQKSAEEKMDKTEAQLKEKWDEQKILLKKDWKETLAVQEEQMMQEEKIDSDG